MGSCESLLLQWDLIASEKAPEIGDGSRDGLWHGYPSRYKYVWKTLSGFWQDVTGKFRPHVLPPSESLLSLHQVAKCLTMKLATHLAKEVAPFSGRFLHMNSSSRYNATREGERKRPSSGLARVAAYPKPPKQQKPSASGTSFSDWIGGTCCADTLQVWFPAHWAPVVLQQLQQKEDNHRAENLSWMDQEVAPANMARGTGKPTFAVQGWQLSRCFLGEQHSYANRHH